jgi:hypothetical protein
VKPKEKKGKTMTLHTCKKTALILGVLAFLAAPLNAQPRRGGPRTTTPSSARLTISNCPLGEGLWELSNGGLECRSCPRDEELQSGHILKLPMGCAAPVPGGFLEMPLYLEMKASEEYCIELENYRSQVAPSMDRLKSTLNQLIENVSNSDKLRYATLERLQDVKERNALLAGQNRLLFGATITLSVITVLSIALTTITLYNTQTLK